MYNPDFTPLRFNNISPPSIEMDLNNPTRVSLHHPSPVPHPSHFSHGPIDALTLNNLSGRSSNTKAKPSEASAFWRTLLAGSCLAYWNKTAHIHQ